MQSGDACDEAGMRDMAALIGCDIPGGSGDGGSDSGAYKKGDVNNDGKLTPADYVKVKNHIMGNSKLSGKALTAADMNKDGKVTPADYVKIKNEIMNK